MKEKDFDGWIKVKENLHFFGTFRSIKEGEIWWCSVGENVGVEINGKQELFLRPVLIMKKLSKFGFMAIPLTSKEHAGPWYIKFIFKNKNQYANLSQARMMSVNRLCRKMGTVPQSDLGLVKNGFKKLFL